MNLIQRLREQIDACRAGSDDLTLPAMEDLARAAEHDHAVAAELARSQQFDRAVAGAMHDVELPTGLLDRLLVAAQADNPADEVCLPLPNEPASSPAKRSRLSRRTLVFSGSIALAALLAMSGSWVLLRPKRVVTQNELNVAVSKWMEALARQPQVWQPIPKNFVSAFQIDPAIVGKPDRWQQFRDGNIGGSSASVTAINLAPPSSPGAILFIVRTSARYNVPAVPSPGLRLSLSRGFTATAWQRERSPYVYVLVVEEDRGQRLENFLQRLFAA
jgi:hypothetical protein